MIDTVFKVGDLIYFNLEADFAVIYDIYTTYRGNNVYERTIKIFWQREQTTTTYFNSSLEFMIAKRSIEYPVGKQSMFKQ